MLEAWSARILRVCHTAMALVSSDALEHVAC
jgi:hypothetical protein